MRISCGVGSTSLKIALGVGVEGNRSFEGWLAWVGWPLIKQPESCQHPTAGEGTRVSDLMPSCLASLT